ncbi:MAG TPA: trypsin-like peptidase domain-containing protein [Bryobacteraceae bacterium]|jgi:S1-C subfamily serine protease|nr:trypsin-like peptidase domain-containing protein [Bryobacteraceae bacterium]
MKLRTFFLAAIFVGGFVYITGRPNSFWRRAAVDTPLWSGPQIAHSAGLGSDEQNNIDIYKSAKESVVYITSTVYTQTFFFVQTGRALGSGFIINPDGQILTNYHVIEGGQDVEVTLPDQKTYKAKVLVPDRQDDLALIQIQPRRRLPSLPLGDSDHLQVGQKVLAIGQPFGFKGTLTVGVVSSLGVSIQGENNRELDGMIQTDAAINSGNSGGPLLDSQGSVIGINTAIYGPNGGNVGIGFASPINRAKMMLEDFRAGRSFKPARLGVTTVFIAGDLAEALKLPSSGGLLVQTVARGSAAEQAGIRGARDEVRVGNARLGVGGDFVTAVDGKPVTEPDQIIRATSRKRPGDILDLTVYRNGRSIQVKVKLGEAQDEPM